MRRYYPAVIDFNSDAVPGTKGEIGGVYGVVFPDVPGCYSAGDTIDEAVTNAREALTGHLALMAEEGMEIPEPSTLADVRPDPEVSLAAIALIEAAMPSKPMRVNISMDSDLLDQIDAVATNRSAFLAEGARALLSRSTSMPERAMARSSATGKVSRRDQRKTERDEIARLLTKKT